MDLDLSPEQTLNPIEAETIARGLYAIAQCDGVHEREAALIASFWADSGGGAQALAELSRRPAIEPKELAAHLPEPAVRELFMKTALLLAWVDGVFTDQEKALVGAYAAALDIDTDGMQALDTQVKEYLLSHLTHLQNSASAAKVAKKLGV